MDNLLMLLNNQGNPTGVGEGMKKALLVMFENNIIFKRMRQHKFLLIVELCMSIALSCSGGSGGGNKPKNGGIAD
jgi:hypothetical protein